MIKLSLIYSLLRISKFTDRGTIKKSKVVNVTYTGLETIYFTSNNFTEIKELTEYI